MEVTLTAIWLGTTAWVAIDSLRREWPTLSRDRARHLSLDRPWKWTVATLLLWPIVLPMYVYRRVYAPLKAPRWEFAFLRRLPWRSSRGNRR